MFEGHAYEEERTEIKEPVKKAKEKNMLVNGRREEKFYC